MKRRAVGSLSVFFALLLVISSVYPPSAVSSDGKSFLWEVRSKTSTIYLLGSLHLMRRESYPLAEEIEKAFEKSDVLAVEANINDPGRIDIPKLMERAFYPDEEGLDKHVSKETYDRVRREAEAFGLPVDVLSRQRPWFLALTFTTLELARLGFDPAYGIDMHFLSKAKGKKRILELESIDYQIDLLSGFSDSEQELFLAYTLKDLENMEGEADTLLTAWRQGDAKGIETLMLKGAEEEKKISAINEKLFYERNRNMASKIEELLAPNGTSFVVVGAGHLVGKKGIIELLRKRGYSIEQR